MTEADEQRQETDRKLKERVMSDPDIISTMIMRVVKVPAQRRLVRFKTDDGREALSSGDIPSALTLFQYSIGIDYKMDGADSKTTMTGYNLAFPIRSPEREVEIIKAASTKERSAK